VRITFDKFMLADFGRGSVGKPGSPYNMSFDGQRAVQVDDGPRWEHAQFRDRKNRSLALSFTSEQEHDSYGVCQAFIADLNETLPVIGELVWISTKVNGGTVRRSCKTAALTGIKAVQFGVRSIATYSFLINEIQTSKV
jgi:hypothetical protein